MEEVTFESSVDDFVYATRNHLRRQPRWWLSIGIATACILMGAYLIYLEGGGIIGWFVMAYGVFAAIYWWIWTPVRAGRFFKRQHQAQGENTIAVDESRAQCRSASLDSTWRELIKVVRTDRLLLMYTTPGMFIMLPRRACRDAAQYERIEQLARGLVKK